LPNTDVVLKEIIEVFNFESIKEKQNKLAVGYQFLIFKYSPACSFSYFVEKSFDKWFNNLSNETKLVAVKINVIESRSLSQEIAEKFNIRHESPQAIWLNENGEVKWQASHSRISPKDLTELLN
jgi:bacillithiol system protein YtxJ